MNRIIEKHSFTIILIMNVLIVLSQVFFDTLYSDALKYSAYGVSIAKLAFSQIFPFVFITPMISNSISTEFSDDEDDPSNMLLRLNINTSMIGNIITNFKLAGTIAVVTAFLLGISLFAKEWSLIIGTFSIVLSMTYFYKILKAKSSLIDNSNLSTYIAK